MTAHAARWAREDRFSMRYGAPAILLGWFITFFAFCLGLTVSAMVSEGPGGMGAGFMVLALIYGSPVALIAGLPLSLLVAWPLRRVRDQRLHVVAFAVALGFAMAGYLLVIGEGRIEPLGFAAVLLAAACGAIGRASVIKLVARRNPPDPD